MASRGGTTEQAENKVEALPTDRVCQPGQSKPSRNNLRLIAERWPLDECRGKNFGGSCGLSELVMMDDVKATTQYAMACNMSRHTRLSMLQIIITIKES